MKKIFIVLISLLLLAGCSNSSAYSKVNNENEIIFKGPSIEYTKADLYKVLKLNATTTVENQIINHIAEKENIDFDKLQKETDEYVNSMIEYGLESTIISYYGSVEAYSQMYKDNLVQMEILKNYVSGKIDQYLGIDKPIKMQMAYFDEEEAANKFLADVKAGKDFSEAANENGYSLDSSEYISLSTDDINQDVRDYLNSTSNTGISSIITSTTSTLDEEGKSVEKNRYYVINITDRDVNNFKEDYIAVKAEEMSISTILDELLEECNIEFYDQDLYNQLTTAHEGLK